MKLAIAIVALLVNGCTMPVTHYTPSGRPEVTINGKVGKEVHAEITNLMLNNGYNVKKATDNLLVFEKPYQSTMAAVFFGSQYDPTPTARVTFSIVELADSTRVVASFAVVTNPGSAFERITQANNHPSTLKYQKRLDEIKVKLETRRR